MHSNTLEFKIKEYDHIEFKTWQNQYEQKGNTHLST